MLFAVPRAFFPFLVTKVETTTTMMVMGSRCCCCCCCCRCSQRRQRQPGLHFLLWCLVLQSLGTAVHCFVFHKSAFASPCSRPSISRRLSMKVPITTRGTASNDDAENCSDRRTFLLESLSWTTTAAALLGSSGAQARGLVMFPCTNGLGNTYHFMRAGESIIESEDIWSTNPLFL